MSQLPIPITRNLQSLRRAVRSWLLVRGFGYLLATITILVLASMLLDAAFHFDVTQRAILLALMAAAVIVVIVRYILRPISRPMDDEVLCMRVETRHRELGQSLISAVSFARGFDAEALGVSPVMVNATIARGAEAAGRIRFDDVIDRQGMQRYGMIGLGSLAVLAAVLVAGTLLYPEMLGLWARRTFLLSSETWPRKTTLIIEGLQEDGTVAFPRGDDWDQFVQATGQRIPSAVYIEYRSVDAGRSTTDQMVRVPGDRFRYGFKAVINDFRFRLRGGDHTTDWIQVRLVDRPAVDEVSLTLHMPEYTGVAPAALRLGEASYQVLAGSRIEVSGIANKPLKSAEIHLGRDKVADLSLSPAEPAADNPTGMPRTRFHGFVEADQLESGAYQVQLVDEVDLPNRRATRFTLRVVADHVPQVRSRLMGISGIVSPAALMPIFTEFADDYAITDAWLIYEGRLEGTRQGPTGRIPFEHLKNSFGKSEFSDEYRFDIEPLELPVGSSIMFSIHARDNDTLTGPKEGQSAPFVLRVVSTRELRDDLIRREQEQRMEFERVLSEQQDMLSETQVVLTRLRRDGKLSDEDRQALSTLERQQHRLGNRCMGIADRFEMILSEYINNRLEDSRGAMMQRLEAGVLVPLRDLPRAELERASRHLDAARRGNLSLEDRQRTLVLAEGQQRAAIARMRQVLNYMHKLEGYQEAVKLLNEIMGDQDEVYKQTLRKLREAWGD